MASNGHKIERVFPLLLELEKSDNDYIPQAVSLGPYHHGETKLAFVEAIKPRAIELFVSGGPEGEGFYYDRVVGIIEEIRDCYAQDSVLRDFSDAYLARMMLRDGAFLVTYMEISAGTMEDSKRQLMVQEMFDDLGTLILAILWRDLVLLGNQIPLYVVKLLTDARYGVGYDHHKLLDRFMSNVFRKEKETARAHEESMRGEPLHLLEAYHRLIVKAAAPPPTGDTVDVDDDPEIGAIRPADNLNGASPAVCRLIHCLLKTLCCKNGTKKPPKSNDDDDDEEEDEDYGTLVHSFRTVKDLKANGIYFKPSPSRSLKDVRFRSHFFFYARLELPEWFVSHYTKAFFKNLVAFEVIPNSPAQGEVASYINLMKSLIEGPDDVKELREKRILFNMLGSDQEVLSVYKDIDTHGVDNPRVFQLVKDQIEAHYNSRVEKWMAELFHNNFRSPWTAIAFLAAFAVLALSAAQLYFAANPLRH